MCSGDGTNLFLSQIGIKANMTRSNVDESLE